LNRLRVEGIAHFVKESPMRNAFVFASTAAALIAVAACNSAENAPPADEQAPAAENVATGNASAADVAAVMKARHDHYEEMGDAMKAINGELKGSAPSAQTIQQHAAVIARYGPQLLTWFPEGSGPEAGKTRAKAEIWSDPQTFRQRAQAFEAQAARFNQVAQSGDAEAIREALPALSETCKNCHDRFRAPED
jgi:cytochrome c556